LDVLALQSLPPNSQASQLKSDQIFLEFAQGKVDPVEAGKMGGKSSGGGTSDSSSADSSSGSSGGDYKPTEHDGLKKDGTPDGRVKGN